MIRPPIELVLGLSSLAALACDRSGDVIRERGRPIRLPIEVIGVDGAEETVVVRLTAAQAAQARAVRLRVHGLGSGGAVRLGSGPWAPLGNDTVELAPPARAFGGIGGALSTLTATWRPPPGAFVEGDNALGFRYRGTDGISIGYRVFGLEILDEAGTGLLPASAVEHEDPGAWPRAASAREIEEGARLWRGAPLSEPSRPPAAAGARRALVARCADCHTQDGRDLQYFAYSSRAIIERARFHGLSTAQGAAIAAYVRTRTVAPLGRPWNPPYQPGPGVDGRPLGAWAAGAGWQNVLASDEGTVEALFPAGASLDERVATKGRLNVRETPVMLPLPDWNRWIPRVHPADAWPDRFPGSELPRLYDQMRASLATRPGTYVPGQLRDDLKKWDAARIALERFAGSAPGAGTRASREALHALAQWQLVKLWELLQEFSLEGIGADEYAPHGEPRTWFGRSTFAMHAAPPVARDDASSPYGSRLVATYLRNAFHHLALVVSPGNRRHEAHAPFSFVDAQNALGDLGDLTTIREPGRMLLMFVKGMQEADNGIGPGDPVRGWSFQGLADPNWLFHPALRRTFDPLPVDRRREIQRALVRAWWSGVAAFSIDSWKRSDGGDGDGWAVPPASYRPSPSFDGLPPDRLLADIPEIRVIGTDPAVVEAILDWGKRMWPLGPWDSFRR